MKSENPDCQQFLGVYTRAYVCVCGQPVHDWHFGAGINVSRDGMEQYTSFFWATDWNNIHINTNGGEETDWIRGDTTVNLYESSYYNEHLPS